MIKRFMVFGGLQYYPRGGWDDFLDSFDNVEEAKAFAENACKVGEIKLAVSDSCSVTCRIHKTPAVCRNYDMSWAQVVDLHTGIIISLSVEGDYCPICQTVPDFPNWSVAA